HHDLQRDCVAAVPGAVHRSRSFESPQAFDLQHLRRRGAALHRGDDDCGVRGEITTRNCKLKVENYKLQSGRLPSIGCWRKSRSLNLQFAFCNFQFSMSLLLALLLPVVLAIAASAQTK